MFAKGHFICSSSGALIGPDTAAPSVHDAASALGKLCRYAGHSKNFYSVLIHSLIVSDLAEDSAKLYALVHDTTESVINDIPTPFKISGMAELENRMYSRILKDWDIPYPSKHIIIEVHRADAEALQGEIWTNGPPGLKKLKKYRRRSFKAEKLVRQYQKKYPPKDTIRASGQAVREFVSRFKQYKSLMERGEV